jgi:hypothetical protein
MAALVFLEDGTTVPFTQSVEFELPALDPVDKP